MKNFRNIKFSLRGMRNRMKKTKNRNAERGATTLIITFFVLTTILMIALTAASVMVFEIRMAKEIGDSIPAFYASDAAAEKCLYQARRLDDDLECNRNVGSTSVTLDNGATATAERKNTQINASGTFAQTRRSVELDW